MDIEERAEDRDEEGREKEIKTARCIPRPKSTVTRGAGLRPTLLMSRGGE